jgi:hypothetical protein
MHRPASYGLAPGRAACGFLILGHARAHAGFAEHRGRQRWHGAGRRGRGKSYRPAAIGAIKQCFTNRTGEQHPPNAGPSASSPAGSLQRPPRARPCCGSKTERGADVRYRGRQCRSGGLVLTHLGSGVCIAAVEMCGGGEQYAFLPGPFENAPIHSIGGIGYARCRYCNRQ